MDTSLLVSQGNATTHIRQNTTRHDTFKSAVAAMEELNLVRPDAAVVALSQRPSYSLTVFRRPFLLDDGDLHWALVLGGPDHQRLRTIRRSRSDAMLDLLRQVGIDSPAVPKLLLPIAGHWDVPVPSRYQQLVRRYHHHAPLQALRITEAQSLLPEFITAPQAASLTA